MADMESICARLCLLTRAAWKAQLPTPLSRRIVQKMVRLGALEGLALRHVEGICEETYERAETLLSRSVAIYDEVIRCRNQGYSVMLPGDDGWPERLSVLKENMPQFLFVRGQRALTGKRTISVAGSRIIQAKTSQAAQTIGAQIAAEDYVMASGGAQGVDTAAQSACLHSGGSLILVPAYPCEELLRQGDLSHALDEGKLLILCDTWPDEPFSAQKALSRNHTIYALGHACVVVAARQGVGGSWRGAIDCLREDYSPVFAVDMPGRDFAGNQALFSRGARPLDAYAPLTPQLFGKEARSL